MNALVPGTRSGPGFQTEHRDAGYLLKFERIRGQTLFDRLDAAERETVSAIALDHRFTLQELKTFVDFAIDLMAWNGRSLTATWRRWRTQSALSGREFKKWAFEQLRAFRSELAEQEIEYPSQRRRRRAPPPRKLGALEEDAAVKIFGVCPVRSERTLCCNLHAIDAVRNCGFGCSYCSIQTLYADEDIRVDRRLRDKLDAIVLDPAQRYHIGTGQSSDALMWGNLYGILDDMLRFARKWPNALVEFKTKSANVGHLLRSDVPPSIVCSWSLNPQTIVDHEEHGTATLAARVAAARAVADRGIRVAFHLHPMIAYRGWRDDYAALIRALIDTFHSDEVLFVSFGALTFPKPVLRRIRSSRIGSKIHQMRMVANAEGKLTCADDVKIRLFRHARAAFEPWRDEVFSYLCMEPKRLWEASFGSSYPDNAAFERALLDAAWAKLPARGRPVPARPREPGIPRRMPA